MKFQRSLSIDALRGIAALSIVFYHSHVSLIGIYLYDEFLSFFHRFGSLGVDLFFLLSGYCIHGSYSRIEKGLVVKNYLLRRWWRIYPPYFFALGIAVILNLITNFYKWKSGGIVTTSNFGFATIVSHLFLVHNFSQSTMLTISGPFWTIACEAQYYLLYLVARPFFHNQKGWAMMFLISFILYYMAWRVYYLPATVQLLNPFCYWIEWILGAFLVFSLRNGQTLNRKFWYLLLFSIFFLLAFFTNHLGTNVNFSTLLYACAFALLILFFLGVEKIWSLPVLKWVPGVGVFSYSIYLVHFLFLDRIRTFTILEVPQGWLRFFVSVSAIILCLFISYVFFLYFERPFIKKAADIAKC